MGRKAGAVTLNRQGIMVAKAQHTVPRLHLEHFAGQHPAGQVWTYDTVAGKKWSQVPSKTGTQTHFYSVEREDGTKDTRIEEMLSGFESRAAPVYHALLKGDIPKPDTQERVHFAEFMAILFVRTSAMRQMNAEMQSRLLQVQSFAYATNDRAFERMIAAVEKERGEKIDVATKEKVRRAMIDPSGYTIEIPKYMTLQAIGVADDLAPILYNMKWSLVHARDGFFITSDNPLVRTTDPATHLPGRGDGGFKNKAAEVTLPLSTDVVLIASWDRDAPDHGSFDREHVGYVNKVRRAHADRFLYAHVDEPGIAEMERSHKRTGVRLSSFGYGPSKHATTTVGRK